MSQEQHDALAKAQAIIEHLQEEELRAQARVTVEGMLLIYRYPNDERLNDLRAAIQNLDTMRGRVGEYLRNEYTQAVDGAMKAIVAGGSNV